MNPALSIPPPNDSPQVRAAAWVLPLATALAAGLGGLASTQAPTFYAELMRPAWAPPSWLFGPVWSLLYAAMALAAFWVARTPHRLRVTALSLFGLQLLANAAWSWLFFRWHDGALALADLVLLWLLLAATAALFFRIRRASGWLMLPVLAWVTFAGALNVAVWRLNPALLA